MAQRRRVRTTSVRKAASGLLVFAIAATGLLVAAPAASAATGRVLADPDINVRDSPGGGNIIGHITKGTTITIECTEQGTPVAGPYGTIATWDGIRFNGRRGFVSDAWMFTGSNGAVAGDCPDWPVVTTTTTQQSRGGGGGSAVAVAINVLRCVDRPACGTQQVITTYNAGQAVSMECWQDGYTANVRYSSPRWFYVSGGGIKGFVHSSSIDANRQASVGRCSDVSRAHKAADWALAHEGSLSAAPGAERNGNKMDPDAKWNGWCLLFAGDAWRIGVGIAVPSLGTAANATTVFRSQGKLKSGEPPRGAMVLWGANVGGHGVGPTGHIAIALGNGEMMTTQGYGTKPTEKALPIARIPILTYGQPSGWVVL